MTDAPTDENEVQPFRLMDLPPGVRELVLQQVFQDHRDYINAMTFPLPAIFPSNPRFRRAYRVALRQRVFAVLHVNRALRLESFDAFTPLAVGFWRAVADEQYELLEERSQRGDSAVLADDGFRERNYRNALRAEGGMQIFLALAQAAQTRKSQVAGQHNQNQSQS